MVGDMNNRIWDLYLHKLIEDETVRIDNAHSTSDHIFFRIDHMK